MNIKKKNSEKRNRLLDGFIDIIVSREPIMHNHSISLDDVEFTKLSTNFEKIINMMKEKDKEND